MTDQLRLRSRRHRRSVSSRTVTVEVGRQSAWLRGAGLIRLVNQVGAPRTWSPREKCLTVPIDRVWDILALAEHRDNRVVTVVAVDR